MPAAYYEDLGEGRFAPTGAAVGPWDARFCHGSPPAALLVHAIERAFPRPDARLARVAFDFLGPVPVAPCAIRAEVVRPGERIELARAELAVGGRVAMQATAWRIAASPGRAPEVRDARPAPTLPGPQPRPTFGDVASFGYGESLELRFVEGAFETLGPATVFARPRLPLLAGVALSPLARLLLLVDSANGVSAVLPPSRFTFVPVELTVSLHRLPRTEWVGMRAETVVDSGGVGQTRADLFDEEGYVGTASQSLFVAPR